MDKEKAALGRQFLFAVIAPAILAVFVFNLEFSEAITARITGSPGFQNAPPAISNFKGMFGVKSADAKAFSVVAIAVLAVLGSLSLARTRKEGTLRALTYAAISYAIALAVFFLVEFGMNRMLGSMVA